MQPDAFADAVVVMVKNALSPVIERLAATEAKLAALEGVRDRLVTVETKVAQPVAMPVVDLPPAVDLTPMLERMAATEARVEILGDLRDRVVVMETKTAQHVMIPAPIQPTMEPLDLSPILDKIEAVKSDANALRERVAVAEMRQLIQGPPGRDGIPGRDGKDGLDGVGYDDLAAEQVDDRTIKLRAIRGLQTKELGSFTFPVEIYRGVYVDGKQYDRGDGVTWGGSEWHCNEGTNSKPGDGSKAWTLKVKRGRDGKDGRDALSLPIVTVK